MGCVEGCSFNENITVPDTKVNFYAWKRMEVSSWVPSSWEVSSWEPLRMGRRMLEREEMEQQR